MPSFVTAQVPRHLPPRGKASLTATFAIKKGDQRLILIRMIYKQQRIADWEIKTGHRTDQFILCGVFIYQNVLKYSDTYFESPVSAEYLRR